MNFKKILCLALMLLAIFTLSACVGEDTPGGNPADQTPTYTVTFDSGVSAQSVKENEKVVAPADPTKDGYAFAGWYNGSTKWNFDNTISQDVTLTAKWTKVHYTISYYDGNEQLTLTPNTYTIESDDVVLPDMTKDNYDFLGWYKDTALTEKVVKITKGSFGDYTLYAKFVAKNYSITYYLYDGVNNDGNPISYSVNTLPLTLGAPTKEGYEFDGWYTDSAYTTAITAITEAIGNVTVYAKWTEAKEEGGDEPIDPPTPPAEEGTYTVTYMDGDKVLALEPTVFDGTEQVTLPNAEKTHYNFLGWYTDAEFAEGTKIETIEIGTAENLVLYARFEAIEYTITYYLEGGVNDEKNIVKYTVEDADFVFFAATREGFTFLGWYTDANCTESITDLSEIPGDITLYADWRIEPNEDGSLILPEDKWD